MTVVPVIGSLGVARVGAVLDDDPLERLLSALPRAARTGVVFDVEGTEEPTPKPTSGEPLVFHLHVQARRHGDDIIVADGASVAVIGPTGDARVRVPMRIADRAPGTEPLFCLMTLALALRQRRLFHLHAGLLIDGTGRGVLVLGQSGAGKTTTCVALAERGLALHGDDVCFAEVGATGAVSVAVPRPLHLGAQTLAAFPRLAALAGASDGRHGPKRTIALAEAYSVRAPGDAASVAVGCVLVPSIVETARTAVAPIDQAAVMGALIESGAYVVVDGLRHGNAQLSLFAALAGTAPGFALAIGRDSLADGDVIAHALRDVVRLGDQ